jgi:hypothetical protein
MNKVGLNRLLISGGFIEERIFSQVKNNQLSEEDTLAVRGRHIGAEYKPYIQWDTDVLCGTKSLGRGLELVVGF